MSAVRSGPALSWQEDIRTASTLLFVPADRPERFQKAAASRPGLVVLDLEDAVATANKESARNHAVAWARTNPCLVRINAAGSNEHEEDVRQLAGLPCGIMLPKAETSSDARRIADALGGSGVVALIETARGILNAAAIAETEGVERLAFGSFDLAAELGVDPSDREALLAARSTLVLASARAGLPGPIDGVTAVIDTHTEIVDDAAYGRRLGFTGKLCIHPRQVPIVSDAFRPSEAELAWATSIVAAKSDGVGVVDGAMVDRPVIERAERILRSSTRITFEAHDQQGED